MILQENMIIIILLGHVCPFMRETSNWDQSYKKTLQNCYSTLLDFMFNILANSWLGYPRIGLTFRGLAWKPWPNMWYACAEGHGKPGVFTQHMITLKFRISYRVWNLETFHDHYTLFKENCCKTQVFWNRRPQKHLPGQKGWWGCRSPGCQGVR